jgi:hypothetical protein
MPQQFLTGSSLPQAKQPTPLGIYLIVGFQFVGVVLSFLSGTNNSVLFTLGQVVDYRTYALGTFRPKISAPMLIVPIVRLCFGARFSNELHSSA